MKRFVTMFILLFAIVATPQTWAQYEEESEDEVVDLAPDIPEDFTGTLSDEDPDSPLFKEKQLFGDNEAGEEREESYGVSHLLRAEFEGQVVFTDTITNISFLEITYEFRIEKEIEIGKSRFRDNAEFDVQTNIVGNLAENDLFKCEAVVEFNNKPTFSIMTKYNVKEATEETDPLNQLALQLKVDQKSIKEDWTADCLGIDGSELKTKGDHEEHLYKILQALELEGVALDEFFPDSGGTKEILTDTIIIEDLNSFEEIAYQGSINISIDPL